MTLDTTTTIEFLLGEYGSLNLRTYIDGATQEALVDFVSRNVFDGVNYYPSRKAPLMSMAFVQGFVVDDVDMLLQADGESADPYIVHAIVAQRLNVFERIKSLAQDEKTSKINNTINELSDAVDAKVSYLISRSAADIAGGAANVSLQTIEELNTMMTTAGEFLAVLKEAVSKNEKKLSGLLTKKNITALFDSLKVLENAVNENAKHLSSDLNGGHK